MVMRARANVYHLECFACQQCGHRFCVGDQFYLHDNQVTNNLNICQTEQPALSGALWSGLRGADGLRLPLLTPTTSCSTQTWRPWRWWPAPPAAAAAAAAGLPDVAERRHLAPGLLPLLLPSSTTHTLASHIISALLPTADLAMKEKNRNKDRKLPLLPTTSMRNNSFP